MWKVLLKEGLWHDIIMDKYFNDLGVYDRIRSQNQWNGNYPYIWRSLISIKQWIAGSGQLIWVGEDNIVGTSRQINLSPQLKETLVEESVTRFGLHNDTFQCK